MIDLRKEQAFTLNKARALPECLRNGRKLNLSTVHRWARHGVTRHGRRIKLETTVQGGATVTTREAIARFFADLTGEPVVQVDHHHQHQQAEYELQAAGL